VTTYTEILTSSGMVGDPCGDLAVAVRAPVWWVHRLDEVRQLVREGPSALVGCGHAVPPDL
jgi:hypothetical protein